MSPRWAVLAPALVALVLYLPSLANGFAFDDVPIVVHNPVAHGLTTFPGPFLTPYWSQYGQAYRPVTVTSLSVDWSIGGGAPWPFHATNVLLHALVTGLCAALVLRWMAPLAALCIGLLFAIHPVHVEAVANVVGRSELLCAIGLLGMALVATSSRLAGASRLFALGGLAALALGSKETGVLAPAIAWAAGIVPRRTTETDSQRHRRALGDAAYTLAGIVPLLIARWLLLGSFIGALPHPAWNVASMTERLELALASLARVAGLMLAPQRAVIDYSPTLTALKNPEWLLIAMGVLLIAVIAAGVLVHFRRPSPYTFALLLSGATLLPVANLVFPAGLIIAERTLYSPSIGVALLMGAGLAAAIAAAPRIAAVGALVWVVPAVWLTLTEIPVWKSSETVYETMLQRAPESYKSYFLVGNLRVDAGRFDEASMLYRRGLSYFDGDPTLLYAAGAHAMRTGDTTHAIDWLGKALRIDPQNRRARGSLVRLLLSRGDSAEARRVIDEGLAREPELRLWKALRDSL